MIRNLLRSQSGSTLVEQLVMIGVVGTVLAASLGALGTGAVGLRIAAARDRAMQLAITQAEYVKTQEYVDSPATYPISVSVPQGFSLTAVGEPVAGADSNVQRVIVSVVSGGQTLLVLEELKVRRP